MGLMSPAPKASKPIPASHQRALNILAERDFVCHEIVYVFPDSFWYFRTPGDQMTAWLHRTGEGDTDSREDLRVFIESGFLTWPSTEIPPPVEA